jgi:20S proteasome subunit beta 6
MSSLIVSESSFVGRGMLYHYDAVGSSERVAALCSGKGEELIQPVLDELTKMEENEELWEFHDDENLEERTPRCIQLTCDEAIALIKNLFKTATEREISLGDGVEIIVLRKDSPGQVERIVYPLSVL